MYMGKSTICCLSFALLSACYSHARRDAPRAAPDDVSGEMIAIPGGAFTMGDQNGQPEEYPEQRIEVSGYWIDQTEVTNYAYEACVQAKACDPSPYLDDPALGKDEYPVVGVSWHDAVAFCAWLEKRLPTEAEWEYAAKGRDYRRWPWQGAFDGDKANTMEADEHTQTAPVWAYEGGKSAFGVLNMAGNAAEWVNDVFDPTHYRTRSVFTDPTGPDTGRERVVRGGSYLDPSHSTRVSSRSAKVSTETDNSVGFRCAKDDG